MMEEKIDDSMSAEEQLQLLLQEAGLESVPIDPASLAALKELVQTPAFHEPTTAAAAAATTTTAMDSSSDQHHRPVSEVTPHPELKRFTSELTTPSYATDDNFSFGATDDTTAASGIAAVAGSNATGGFVPLKGASTVENHILEQLHRQTKIMLEMQRQIDDLSTTVEYMSSTTSNNNNSRDGGAKNDSEAAASVSGKRRFFMAKTANSPEANTPVAPPHPPEAAAAAAGGGGVAAATQPRRIVIRRNNNNDDDRGGGGFLGGIRRSRLYQIASAFLQLRRRYGVLPLDGGLIVKVIFMLAILSSRIMRSSPKRISTKNNSNNNSNQGIVDDTHLKFLALIWLVLMGFLVQTGYLRYSYIFFVKENIAGRIWEGETVEDILRGGRDNNNNNNNNNPENADDDNNNAADGQAAPPRGQQPPGQPQRGHGPGRPNNRENGGLGGWRNTFLGGLIPQGGQGGIVGLFQDIGLVFGSFLLSIFPMWQPEGPPPPPAPQPPADGQQQEGPPQPPGGLAAGPGEVRPPRDAFQAADDDSDDDNDNGGARGAMNE